MTSPQAKASWHYDVSLNFFHIHEAKQNLPLVYKFHHSSLLTYTTTILQGIISCHHGLFFPIKAQDARAIMDGQHHDQRINTLWNHQSLFRQQFLVTKPENACLTQQRQHLELDNDQATKQVTRQSFSQTNHISIYLDENKHCEYEGMVPNTFMQI